MQAIELQDSQEDKIVKTVGFVISHKNNERRRGLLPEDLKSIVHTQQLYFERGYGEAIGHSDEEYEKYGAHIVEREDALACDVLVDVKLGDADYINELKEPKILCGWAHAVQNIEFTSSALNMGHTVIAWEEIFENGRYIFGFLHY